MRRLGGIAAVALALLGVALVALVLAGVAVNRGWQRERLRVVVEEQLSAALGEPVSLGRIEGRLLPRLDLRDLRVGPADAPTLVVEQLTAKLAWRRALASRRLVLRGLTLRGAELSLRRDERGQWPLPDWLAPDEDADPDALPVHVDRTRLDRVSLHVAWSEQGSAAAVRVVGSGTLGSWSLPAEPGETLRGELHARAHGEGAARRWLEQAQLDATLDGPRLVLGSLALTGGATPPLRLAGPAVLSWEDDRLRVDELTLESEAQRLSLSGALSREGFHPLRADLRDLDVTLAGRLLGGAAQPGGRVSGAIRLDGPFLQPEGRVDLVWSEPSLGVGPDAWRAEQVTLRASGDGREIRLEAFTLDGIPGGPLRLARPARLRLRDDSVALSGVELRSAEQALVANGRVSRDAFRELALEVRGLRVGPLGRVLGLPQEPEGTLDGELALDGPFARPTGTVALRWHAPRLRGWRAEDLTLRATLDRKTAQLDATLRATARQQVDVEASVPEPELTLALRADSPTRTRGVLPEGLRVRVHSDALALDAIAPLLWVVAPDLRETLPSDVALRGVLSGDLSLRGGAQPSVAGTLALDDGTLSLPGREPIHPLHAELALDPRPGVLGVERFRLHAPGLDVDASGELTREGPAPALLTLSVPDLGALASAYALSAPLDGALEASLALRGGWTRPSIEGDARWTLPAPDTPIPDRVELVLDTRDQVLVGSLAVHQAQRLAATGELRVPYGSEGLAGLPDGAASGTHLALDAEDFDLATLSPVLPRLVRDLRGRADAHLALRPGAAGPALSGSLRLRDGSIRVPTLRQTFEPIEASLSLLDQTLRIDALRIGRPGRHADVSGELRLDASFRPADFDVGMDLTQLPVARSRPLTSDASGHLRLTGPPDALRLEGAVELASVRVRLVEPGDESLREFDVVTSDAERRARREMQERPRQPDAFERASIDVAVVVPRNSWVRGRGADLDLAGTLRIEKQPAEPVRVSGGVQTLRGTYRFQGRRFDLRRGSVTFAGTRELDPTLDIEAVHRVRDVTIVILLSGFASEPIVTLSSEPPLPEDDVLAYLFFGRPTEELGSRQPATDLDRAAAAFAGGVALREASRLVEDTLPIDTVDVRIDQDGSSGGVGVGKYLTDDLFIRYERGFGKDAVDGVKLELRVSDHWSVETEASSDESAGADLVWSYDY